MTWSDADNSHSRLNHAWSVESESELLSQIELPYSLDQTPLSISRHSWIVVAPSDVLNEIVAALELSLHASSDVLNEIVAALEY